jgi:hypothetical protein
MYLGFGTSLYLMSSQWFPSVFLRVVVDREWIYVLVVLSSNSQKVRIIVVLKIHLMKQYQLLFDDNPFIKRYSYETKSPTTY